MEEKQGLLHDLVVERWVPHLGCQPAIVKGHLLSRARFPRFEGSSSGENSASSLDGLVLKSG
jgi:hypothetical protein